MDRINRKKGEINDKLFLIVVVALLLISWLNILSNKKNGVHFATSTDPFAFSSGILNNPSKGTSAQPQTPAGVDINKSIYYGDISIDIGNAPNEYQPSNEYITLYASYNLKNPISLSGWYLTNGKGSRVYQVGSSLQHFKSDIVYLPQAVEVFSPSVSRQLAVPLLLPPNGRVNVVSGRNQYKGTQLPSFRQNECTGFLTREKSNPLVLTPNINGYCPAPAKEVNNVVLDTSCRQFVDYMSSCHTPNFVDSVVIDYVPQSGYVDGVGGLSQSCQDFLREHYGYNACLANHKQDENFLTDIWYVYLNRTFELWATDHEVITLYDNKGKIVSEYSY